jgi:hypothetical protein
LKSGVRFLMLAPWSIGAAAPLSIANLQNGINLMCAQDVAEGVLAGVNAGAKRMAVEVQELPPPASAASDHLESFFFV